MKAIILSLFLFTNSYAQACKQMIYLVDIPAMRSIEENSAYKKTIEADVAKVLKLRGYTPVLDREARIDRQNGSFCMLNFTVHEWPSRIWDNSDEVKSTAQIWVYVDGVGSKVFTSNSGYKNALYLIPKQSSF